MNAGMFGLATLMVSSGAAQPALPPAEQILDRYVEVTGGRAAYERFQSEVRNTTMEVKGRDLRLAITTYRARPGRMYSATEIPGVGRVEEGVDGDVAWSVAPGRGAALKEGAERSFALYGARLDAELNWREWFPKAETEALEEWDGKMCYRLKLTEKDGESHIRYYDKETGYFVRMQVEVKLPQGKFPMDLRLSDYRDAGEIKMAHRTLRVMPGQEMESRVEKVEINGEIDPARFASPEAVKVLLAKPKAEK